MLLWNFNEENFAMRTDEKTELEPTWCTTRIEFV